LKKQENLKIFLLPKKINFFLLPKNLKMINIKTILYRGKVSLGGEKKKMVSKLFDTGLTFVLLVATLMIGTAVVSKTYFVTNSTAPSTLLNNVFDQGGQAITTLTGFLPIVAIAVVGGIALYYLIAYLGGGSRAA
jgi:hypothetical protein